MAAAAMRRARRAEEARWMGRDWCAEWGGREGLRRDMDFPEIGAAGAGAGGAFP